MERKRKYWLILHGLLMIYSTTSVFGKLASGEDFLGYKFCIYFSQFGGIFIHCLMSSRWFLLSSVY